MDQLTPKRKRLTRQEKKDQTRERLLEAATELFAARGYEGAAVEEIAERAGYSRGAFYSNFANKEELMKAIISRGFDGDIDGIRGMREIEGVDALASAYREIARSFYEDPMNLLWMLEFQLSAVRHPELRSEYAEQHKKLRSEIKTVLMKHLQREGLENPEQYAEYADLFLVIMTGLSLFKLIHGDDIDANTFETAFRAVLAGMSAPGSAPQR